MCCKARPARALCSSFTASCRIGLSLDAQQMPDVLTEEDALPKSRMLPDGRRCTHA
jgi:hypothetical protein